uniref:Aquaporin-like protein n=1 Tax=Rhizophora mucronata TaxID=61149 RepID=A0A2P2JIK1_RHIMU
MVIYKNRKVATNSAIPAL